MNPTLLFTSTELSRAPEMSPLLFLKGKKKKEKKPEVPPITITPIPPDYDTIEEYWIKEPFAKVIVAQPPEKGVSPRYFIEEITLAENENKAFTKILDILAKELNPPEIGREEDVRKEIVSGAQKLIQKYKRVFGKIEESSWFKVLYFLERDMLGFGHLNTIMEDYRVEDVSCDGVGSPIYVWHRKYESIPTNVQFMNRDTLDDYIIKLAHKSGKHVSSAFPIVDAMLYGKHRLAASFRDEVSPRGSTFTIRKFREEPFSIIDLIETGTCSIEMAAYFWLLLENKATVIVIGGTGSGKTTSLNALCCLIKPGTKIVTVEETAELNMPVENWVRFVSRESYGLTGTKVGQISLFDLVRTSLRYRPDYLIVGEVRGEEAFVLFQALATGHGGLSTLHAENLDYAVKRLTSTPMNIAESYIPLMNCCCLIERVALPLERGGLTFGRRMRSVWEVLDYGKYANVSEWNPNQDDFQTDFRSSYILGKLAARLGRSRKDFMDEMERRMAVLQWMLDRGIRSVKDVSMVVAEYYSNPEVVYNRLTREPSAEPVEEEVSAEEILVQPTPLADLPEQQMPEAASEPPREEVFSVPDTAEKVATEPPSKEAGAAIGDLEDSMVRIMDLIMKHGGTATVEVALKETGIDRDLFWKCINVLKDLGYVKMKGFIIMSQL